MQYIVIVSFIFVFMYLLKTYKYKDVLSKRIILIYTIVWGLVICTSTFGIYGFNIPSSEVIAMMTIHVICFIVGFNKCNIKTETSYRFSLNYLDKSLNRITDNNLFIFITCILALYVSSLFLKFMKILAIMSMSELRTDFYESGIYGPLFSIINGPILSTFNLFLIPIFSWMLFKKRNWFLVVQSLFLLGYASLGGGRFGFLRIAIGIVFVGFCLYMNKENQKRRIKQIVFLSLTFVFLIGVMTISRLSVSTQGKEGVQDAINATSEQMVSYAVGPISAFDYAVSHNYKERIGGYKYGGLTLAAPNLLIYIIFNKIGIKYEKALDDLVEIKQDENIYIGDSSWNALYTSLLYYYLDFGWIGIVLIPLFFGYLLRYMIKCLYKTNSIGHFIIITYMFHEIIRAITDYTFVGVFVLILMVGLHIISTIPHKV